MKFTIDHFNINVLDLEKSLQFYEEAAHKGAGVDELIAAVNQAADAYPWKRSYRAFPGPNSNTFTAWVARQVPKLELDLPLSAIGSGYLE